MKTSDDSELDSEESMHDLESPNSLFKNARNSEVPHSVKPLFLKSICDGLQKIGSFKSNEMIPKEFDVTIKYPE